MWELVSWPGIKPGATALGAQSLSHWTAREVPHSTFLFPVISSHLQSIAPFSDPSPENGLHPRPLCVATFNVQLDLVDGSQHCRPVRIQYCRPWFLKLLGLLRHQGLFTSSFGFFFFFICLFSPFLLTSRLLFAFPSLSSLSVDDGWAIHVINRNAFGASELVIKMYKSLYAWGLQCCDDRGIPPKK